MWNNIEKANRRGKIMGGLLVVTAGSLFLARELGVEIPAWLLTWKMLLVGLGLILAVKHKFMHPGWVLLVGAGSVFLLGDIYPHLNIKPIIWPIVLILIGLAIMFKPRRKHFGRYRQHWKKWEQRHGHRYNHHYQDFCKREEPSDEDFLESTAIMAGVKKNVLTKNFKGAEITNVFGGTELNLTQADFEGKATLEITQVFGGTKLIVPANWEIRSGDMVTVLGSVEDKRPVPPQPVNEGAKVLVLTGVIIFGGIDIRTF